MTLDAWLAELVRNPPNWFQINALVNEYISAGRYRAALAVCDHFPAAALAEARPAQEGAALLVPINLAEAHYNLGAWQSAWDLIAAHDEAVLGDALGRAALAMQRAWILANRTDGGRDGAAALVLCQRTQLGDLPPAFRAEFHFTRATAWLANGETHAAWQAVTDGLDCVRRPASERNAYALLGRIAFAEGELREAQAQLAYAAAHPHRGQGGDGLLAWGDVLSALGRAKRAREAWARAVAQDPESESARVAATRLG